MNNLPVQPKRRFNLRIKLPLAIITLLVFSFILVTVLSVLVSRATLTETLKESLATEATLQAEGIRSYLVWTQSMAIDISTVAEAINLDEETSKRVIERMLADNEQIVGSTIAYEPYKFKPDMEFWAPYYNRTNDGQLVFTQLGTPENNYPAQDWYRLAKEANDIILSPPYFDAGGAKIWMVTWSVPFQNNSNELMGIATTDIAFSQTQEIVRRIAVGEQGYAFLVDPNGVVLGIGDQGGQYKIMEDRLFVPDASEQADLWNQLITDMIGGNSGFVDLMDPKGTAVFVAYEPIGMDTGWSLGLAFPQEELFRPSVQLQNSLTFVSVVILGIAIVILLVLSRSITRPLQEITAWAQFFSGGQMGHSPQALKIKTNDEIEDLADAFSQMSTELASTLNTLEQRVTDRTKALETSTEVSRRLSTILDEKELVEEVVNQVRNSFGYYHTQIYFYDDARENLIMTGGTGEAGEKMLKQFHKVAKGRGLVGRAAETNEPILVSDTASNPDWLPNVLLPDTKSEVAIPISIGDQVLGVLDVQHNIAEGLQREDIDALQSIANQVAVALQNIGSTEAITKRATELQTVANISTAAATIIDVEDMLQEVVHLTQRGFGLYHAHVFTYNENTHALDIVACGYREGDEHEGTHGTTSIPLEQEQSLVARAGRTRKAVIVNDVRSDPGWLPNPILTETAAELAVPLIVGDQLLGVLDVQSERINAFTEEDASIQTTLASQVATALQNARSFQQAQRQAERETSVNLITQKIQGTTSIEMALQVAARELGHALGMKPTVVTLESETLVKDKSGVAAKE